MSDVAGTIDTLNDPTILGRLRADMLRFARLQLGNDDEAEDAVQEALAAAIKGAAKFRGEAALKSWMIAILKNKLADVLRRRARAPLSVSQMRADDDGLPPIFDRRGLWQSAAKPAAWADPAAALGDRQLLAVFDACLNHLPARQGRVFLMREVVELGTDEIAAELGLSLANIHVILHRARLGLRACVERHWFADADRS